MTALAQAPTSPMTSVGQSLAPAHGSSFVWTSIEGYEPMENCHTKDGQEVGWIRPARIGKSRPQPWGSAEDWPGEWQAIPHRYDEERQPIDWALSTYQPSYAAAKEWIECGWTNDDSQTEK